ncbi:AMP-binding protein [bacterium]|nr:AMP-binding protein [bacterium]
MSKWPSLSAMHRSQSELLGPRVALRYPRHGLYHDISWTDYRQQADRAAAGLLQLGVQPGDRVAILAENRFEWLIADHAILSIGAADVPLHAPLAPAQVAYQVGHSESRGIVVSNQEQADKVFEVLDSLPQLEFLVAFESVESRSDRIRVLSWDQLRHGFSGEQLADGLREVRQREAALHSESLATIIYTSGTTGNPKGVMLTHGNLLSNAASTCDISFITTDDTLLSWLPYSHIYARCVDHYLTSIAGVIVALAECVDTLMANLAQTQPHWLTSVPRVYEKVWNSVATLDEETRNAALRCVFGPRVKQLTSGGAPLPRQIAEGFFAAGLPLLEGYGLTESSPVITFNSIEQYRIGSVGKPLHDVEVRIADDGEILTCGPHVMRGYWKNEEATNETIVDGWLKTGDVGYLDDDGFLFITDREKDLFVTSAGKNIAPAELERLLCRDEYIDQAVVYGDGRQFVSALIVPDFARLRSIAADLGVDPSSEDEFLTTPELLTFLGERVETAMQQVSQPERVKKFLVLARPFQVSDGELTATLKVRRRHIITRYEDRLAALYD